MAPKNARICGILEQGRETQGANFDEGFYSMKWNRGSLLKRNSY